MSDTKACCHCKHFAPYPGIDAASAAQLAKCSRSATVLDLITGDQRHRFCEGERANPLACGVEAKHFEPDNCDITP